MRRSLAIHRQMRDSIEQEIAARARAHQATIARLKGARRTMALAGAAPAAAPLVMLAHGDSWFDYPLAGNGLSLGDTDVIAQLRTMGQVNPIILNVSHYGDASTDELSWPKQQRMIDALSDSANWLEAAAPDAILFSGGGNDIAGDQFCIFLNYATPGTSGLNIARLEKALGMVEASYLDLFAFRDRYAPGVPIFGHCYDFPIPNGAHPDCAGPWLKPSLDYSGWTDLDAGMAIVRQALIEFRNLLERLASNPDHNFFLVATQGSLGPQDWANELHPFPDGFKKIAARFVDTLRGKFPGRI
jgi:hypothetical protein